MLRDLAAASPARPHVIFTGGDPLKRPDLLALVGYGAGLGLDVSVAPSATVGLSSELIHGLKAAGVDVAEPRRPERRAPRAHPPPRHRRPPAGRTPQHTTVDKGHGRIEERRLWASDELAGYSEFPYLRQAFRIERLVTTLAGTPLRTEVS